MYCYFHHCKYGLLLGLILVIMKWLAFLHLSSFLIKSDHKYLFFLLENILPKISLCMRIK